MPQNQSARSLFWTALYRRLVLSLVFSLGILVVAQNAYADRYRYFVKSTCRNMATRIYVMELPHLDPIDLLICSPEVDETNKTVKDQFTVTYDGDILLDLFGVNRECNWKQTTVKLGKTFRKECQLSGNRKATIFLKPFRQLD